MSPEEERALRMAYPSGRAEEFDWSTVPDDDVARMRELADALGSVAHLRVEFDMRSSDDRSHPLVLSQLDTPSFAAWMRAGRETRVAIIERSPSPVEYYWLRVSFVLPVWSGTPNSWFATARGNVQVRPELAMLSPNWPAREKAVGRVLSSFGYRHMPHGEQVEIVSWLLERDWTAPSEHAPDDEAPPLRPTSLGCAVFGLQ